MTNFSDFHTARVVSVSQPVNGNTPEQELVNTARVSSPDNIGKGGDERLLGYLIRHKHWSPFEMAHVEMCIDTTRDISRQIIRHRSFSFQEFSQRYAAVTLDMVPRECRMQDTTNRQSSLDCEDQRKADAFGHFQTQTWVAAIAVYHEMLKAGVAKEQARALLPEGLTPTRIHMAGTLRSWLHYVGLRGGNGTQREHQWIAESAAKALREHFPTVMAAWEAEE